VSATAHDPDQTIAELYRAATGSTSWAHALQRIVDDMDALAAQLVGLDKRTGAIAFSHLNEYGDAEAGLEYVRRYHAVDPRIPLLVEKPVGDWLFCQDHFDDDFAADNPYYRDLLIPYGGRYSACVKLHETAEEVVLVAFLGKGTNPPFGPQHRDYFHRMGTHLSEAVAMHRKLRGMARSGAVGASLISRIARPMALIDGAKNINAANPRFDELVSDGGVLQREGNRLVCADAGVERGLDTAMRDLDRTAPHDRRARVVPLGKQGIPLFALSVAMMIPDETLHAFGDTAQYLLTAHQRPTAPHHDVSLWQAAFNLSPAESKVAAHLFGGKAPKEIAKALHVSPSTIKTHLDALFAKTGTSRQAELVRVLAMVE
jgi:DNA-binding CsgD family transcriptional regulator